MPLQRAVTRQAAVFLPTLGSLTTVAVTRLVRIVSSGDAGAVLEVCTLPASLSFMMPRLTL